MSGLQHINPSLKFTGTRALVMCAQWQAAALQFGASSLTGFPYKQQQVALLHASLMCYECFLVSFLHVLSWPAEDFDYGYLPLAEDDFDWREPTTANANRRSTWTRAGESVWRNMRSSRRRT